MLQKMILSTPIWVWAILAFLIYRGMRASADQEIKFWKIFIIPIVMLMLSIQGIASAFGMPVALALTWLAGIVIAALLTLWMFNRKGVTGDPRRGVISQHGSWIPLVLMMSIFSTKYTVAIMLAIQPGRHESILFASGVCALYGLFNGIFIGRLLAAVAIYRRA